MILLKMRWIYLFMFTLLLPSETQAQQQQNPNIIIIYVDDLGYGDLSSYGGDIPTPNMDRIGKAGIRFTDFYVSAPVCTPSRYSLLTGSYPQRSLHDLDKVIMPGDENHFDVQEVTLAEMLKSHHYRTAIIGKWHLGSARPENLPPYHGFDLFTGHKGGCIDYFYHVYGGMGNFWYVNGELTKEEGYSTELITDHALHFIEQEKDSAHPFFLYLPYNAPHFGKTDPEHVPQVTVSLFEGAYNGYRIMNSLQAPEAYVKRFAHIKDPYRRTYAAMVSSLDDQVGRVLDKLENEKLLDKTMIWFISDNGGYAETYHGHASNGKLRGEKATLHEGGIRIPAMVCWQGQIKAGQVADQPLCNIDLMPTLGKITGFAASLATLPIDGQDISEVLFSQKSVERGLYWRYKDQTAFRKGRWKLFNNQELYDLAADLSEKHNVAGQHPDKVKELQQAFQEIDQKFGSK